jgi:predicted nucleic acid-binding protein
LDSSALSAFATEAGQLRVVLRKAIADGSIVCVPAPVVTEATTGSGARDALVNRALKRCIVVPLDEGLARAAGALRYRHPRAGAIDAMVVACADATPNAIIITSDVGDLRPLAAERDRSKVVELQKMR